MNPNDNLPKFSDNDIQNAGQPPQAPTPAPAPEVHDYLHPIQDEPKHTYHPKRMMLTLGLIVGASLLAVVIMLLYALLPPQSSKKSTNTSQTPTTTTVPADTLTAKQTIEHVAAYFKGAEKAKSPISRPVTAPNKSFYTVIPETAPLISLAGNVMADKSDTQLESILKSMNYDKFVKQVLADGASGTNYLADLTRNDVICQVAVTKQKDAKADHWFEVRCLDMSTYTEHANIQQTLVSLYTPLTASSVQYGFVGKPSTRASKTAGYTLAELPVGTVIDNRLTTTNRLALFYQSPDKLWHYFTDRDTSLLVECENFDTPVLKTAYSGESCRRVKTGAVENVIAPKTKK